MLRSGAQLGGVNPARGHLAPLAGNMTGEMGANPPEAWIGYDAAERRFLRDIAK